MGDHCRCLFGTSELVNDHLTESRIATVDIELPSLLYSLFLSFYTIMSAREKQTNDSNPTLSLSIDPSPPLTITPTSRHSPGLQIPEPTDGYFGYNEEKTFRQVRPWILVYARSLRRRSPSYTAYVTIFNRSKKKCGHIVGNLSLNKTRFLLSWARHFLTHFQTLQYSVPQQLPPPLMPQIRALC
jgi:hypothetical protein